MIETTLVPSSNLVILDKHMGQRLNLQAYISLYTEIYMTCHGGPIPQTTTGEAWQRAVVLRYVPTLGVRPASREVSRVTRPARGPQIPLASVYLQRACFSLFLLFLFSAYIYIEKKKKRNKEEKDKKFTWCPKCPLNDNTWLVIITGLDILF